MRYFEIVKPTTDTISAATDTSGRRGPHQAAEIVPAKRC